MNELWLIIIGTTLGGFFALLGGFLQNYYSTSMSKKNKRFEIIEGFISSYYEYSKCMLALYYFFEHLDDKFKTEYEGAKYEMKTLDKYLHISNIEHEYYDAWRKFSIWYSKLRLYIKDKVIEENVEKISKFITEVEELFPISRNYNEFESLLKDNKRLLEYKEKMVILFKNHNFDMRELHDYLIKKEF